MSPSPPKRASLPPNHPIFGRRDAKREEFCSKKRGFLFFLTLIHPFKNLVNPPLFCFDPSRPCRIVGSNRGGDFGPALSRPVLPSWVVAACSAIVSVRKSVAFPPPDCANNVPFKSM